MSFITNNKRNSSISQVELSIGDGSEQGEIDYAIITKDGEKGIIIIKIDNLLGAFDYTDFCRHEYTVLNYKVFSSSGDAYNKMMKWIGKMCKKPSNSRYFNGVDPYDNQLNTYVFTSDVIQNIFIAKAFNEYKVKGPI